MSGGREQLGPYTYRWSPECFPLGGDSLALGEFATLRPGGRVLDLGCGAGLLLLLCARRYPDLELIGVELDPAAGELARQNLLENGLSGQILLGDLRQLNLPGEMDLVISNPPWYPSGNLGGPARVEGCGFPQLCRTAAKSLKSKGRFALVHRPERLTDLLCALREAGLEPKRLRLCRGKPEKAPYAVLIEAVKAGRPGLELLPDRIGT